MRTVNESVSRSEFLGIKGGRFRIESTLFLLVGILTGFASCSDQNLQVNNSGDAKTFFAYSFDEMNGTIVYDSSGNGNNGTIFGASRVVGKHGTGVSFPLVTSRVNLPYPPYSFNGTASVECWFKIPTLSNTSDYVILAGYDFNGLSLFVHNSKVYLAWDSTTYISSQTTLIEGQWYYLVISSDSVNIKLYLNGIEDNSVNIALPDAYSSGNYTLGTRNIYFGGSSEAYQDNFSGTIDDFKWRKYALSPAEVLENYNNTK